MPSHFTLRMQFGKHQNADKISEQLVQLSKDAPVDEIMFFFFAEEYNNGHETLDEIREWCEVSRPYRQAAKAAGIETSLNPWHSVLHCGRHRKLKPGQDWNLMVGSKGQTEEPVVCYLDSDWQEYFLESLRIYAQEGFRVVWIDDDIRFHNHGDLHWGGCFCDDHVAAFNKKAKTNASRAEIEKACLQPGTPHPWREIWLDMWQETVLEFLDRCRLALGDTKMGLMSSTPESHAAEGRRWDEWFNLFPVHRPHFWGYKNMLGASMINSMVYMDQNRTFQPASIESVPEIENFQYGQWRNSFHQINAKMSLAHVLGANGLNISLFEFVGNDLTDEAERIDFLRRVRPNMDFLADTFPMTMKSVGVGMPWSEDMGRKMETHDGSSWFELQCSCRGWANWLGAAGIAFSAREQASVNALTADIICSFDDDTLKKWLASGLLLDGDAADAICKRGLGEYIGVKSSKFTNQDEQLYSIEVTTVEEFSYRVGGKITVNDIIHTKKMYVPELMDGAQVISEVRDPQFKLVGNGAFVFENALGGKVAVFPWNASLSGEAMMDLHRAAQIQAMVNWIASGENTGSVSGLPWLVPQFMNDADNWQGTVWNMGDDEAYSFTINRPAGMPAIKEAWHLTPAGTRTPVKVEGDKFILDNPLRQWEVIIF